MSRVQKIPGKFPAMFQGKTYGPGPAVVPDEFPSESEYNKILTDAAKSQGTTPLLVSDREAARGAEAGDVAGQLEETAASLGGDPNELDPEDAEKQIEKEKAAAKKAQLEAEKEADKAEKEEEKRRAEEDKRLTKEAEERLKAQEKAEREAAKSDKASGTVSSGKK